MPASGPMSSDDIPDFEALFEATPNLYLVLDTALRIVGVNDAYCRATMTRREDILGRLLFDVFPDNPDETDATGVGNLRASLERVLSAGRPDMMPLQKYDIQRPASEGGGFEERYWSPLNTPVLDRAGKVRWIIHRVEDVTEYVMMERNGELSERTITQLREANETLAQRNIDNATLQRDLELRREELQQASSFLDVVIENIPAMVAVKDAKELRFVLLNRAGEELTGIMRSESLGKNDYDMFPKEQADFFTGEDRKVLASGKLHIIEDEPIQTRHRGVRSLRTYKIPVLDENKQPKYLLAMSEDITERKEAEALLRDVLSASPDAKVVIGEDGRIVFASERCRAVYGYAPEELVGQPATMLTPPDTLEEDSAKVRKELAESSRGITRVVTGLTGLRKDGTTFPSEASLSSHRGTRGQMVIIATRDVSERKAVEEQLRQALKMEAIGNLTGGLAHDFNNLLSIVIGNLDLLREDLEKGSATDGMAEEALSAALRGAELTRRLLAFARKQPLQPKLLDLNDTVSGITKLLARTLGTQIEIELDLNDGVWPANVDPVQLEACLVNLATNARDAMPHGGQLHVKTRNSSLDEDYVSLYPGLEPGEYSMVEVSDTGTGMPKDVVDRIFEPFFTTKREGRGTGLGLSMVFGFMKQSGGHINVYSEPDVGTTFRLYFPRAGGAATAEQASAPAATPGGKEVILAVEDNPGLRALVIKQLTQLGYRCFEAEDGPSALRVLEKERIDLLFTDVVMPGGMSGYELGREALKRWPDLKVLLTSGFPEEKLNGNGSPPWNMRLLIKPYRKEDLARVLRQVISE
ncbi:MAG TPA: PAS domain S-box protein [Devosia sp.]|nr:PAS domain S-box protein [Devosia sp.]